MAELSPKLRRRRSYLVTAPFLAATALAMLTGCDKPEMQRCVDEKGNVVADNLCANQPLADGQQPMLNGAPVPHPYFGGTYFYPYRFYYGGSGGYGVGSHAFGGGYTIVPGHGYATSSGVHTGTVRGGFGSSFGGEGGSHGGGGE